MTNFTYKVVLSCVWPQTMILCGAETSVLAVALAGLHAEGQGLGSARCQTWCLEVCYALEKISIVIVK